MKEIEVKFLEIDVEEVIAKLEAIGAKKVFEGDVDTYKFDTIDRTLKKKNKTLRIRTIGDKAFITCKENLESDAVKKRDEYEVEVSDVQTAKKILEELGFIERKHFHKKRIHYELDDYSFEIDSVTTPEIPTYLEIETQDEKELQQVVSDLDLNIKNAKPWGERTVVKYYKEQSNS